MKSFNSKTYILRALKYILRLFVLLAIVLIAMALTGTLNIEDGRVLEVLFLSNRGLILMALIILLGALYPKMSFMTADVRADMKNDRQTIIDSFAQLGYKLDSESDDTMIFRASKATQRFLMQWDDAVTVKAEEGTYISIEGLKRIVGRIETRLNAMLVR
jgi:hypothetical protein